jgi:hypothetical protein
LKVNDLAPKARPDARNSHRKKNTLSITLERSDHHISIKFYPEIWWPAPVHANSVVVFACIRGSLDPAPGAEFCIEEKIHREVEEVEKGKEKRT